MALLDPYEVGVDGPWSTLEAAHLLRRAGFGGVPSEWEAMVGDGSQMALEETVDMLVDFQPEDPHLDGPAGAGGFGGPFAGLPDDDSNEGIIRNPDNYGPLRGHIFYRMFFTSQPLQEQLSLFLQDHFVSTIDRLDPILGQFQNSVNRKAATVALLLDQTRLLRQIGADEFRETLIQITRSPAMLLFLDNWINGLGEGRAQENYAREVMELFSMGVDNYSEEDVREIAKCLTGETLPNFRDNGAPDAFNYAFRSGNHVPGSKTVFGQQVFEDNTGGETEQVVDLILSRVSVNPNVSTLPAPYNTLPAAAVYMSWKLLRWFVNQNIVLDPPDPIVLELADYMRGTDNADYPFRRYPYDIRACLRIIFLSKFFFDPANHLAIVKTPADFVISALKMTQAAVGRVPGTFDYGRVLNSGTSPSLQMLNMGMDLFNPLDVDGWRHGLPWINAEYLLRRMRFVQDSIRQIPSDAELDTLNAVNGGPLDPDDLPAMLDYFINALVPDDLEFWAPGATDQLMAFLEEAAASTSNTARRFRDQTRGLLFLLMALPMWQMK